MGESGGNPPEEGVPVVNLSELNPRLVMVAGDWHRNQRWGPSAVHAGCAALGNQSPKIILQLGDFGIWAGEWGARYLRALDDALAGEDAQLVFIDGNHEDFNVLGRLRSTQEDLIQVKERIWWGTRGSRWEWQGKTWLALGGAVSVDAATRRQGFTWFPEEEISPADAAKVLLGGKADVMLTHDCPSGVHHTFDPSPPWWDDRDLARSDRHRELLQGICELVQPSLLLHGHLHRAYSRKEDFGWGQAEVAGLDMDGTKGNWIIMDTQNLAWATPEDVKDLPGTDPYPPVRGQVWDWNGVKCVITRMAKDGSWADFRCYSGDTWSKRMKLPLPEEWQLTHEYVAP